MVLVISSLLMGSASLTPQQVYSGLFDGQIGNTAYDVLWNLRLPRTLLAVLVGVHFALAGLILQAVIRNPLADPSVIGVSGGASLMIVIFLLVADIINGTLFSGKTVVSLTWLPFAALLGGLLTAALVLSLSKRSGMNPTKLALNGVAVGAILNAAVMWTILAWGGGRTETSILWLAGSFYGRDFSHVYTILPWTVLGLLALCLVQRPLALLRFNDDLAHSLGLSVFQWRIITISIAVALAASATAVAGPVGFVGLIVPHLARLLVGNQLSHLTISTLLLGGCLTLGADILSRILVHPLELPAGALTTLIGIPVLLFLLQRQSRES
ncbi:FecCD family ABC transporter permease [Methylophaga frappieri]|nr:iron ABC transporter permease [Methylophaga frappieri]